MKGILNRTFQNDVQTLGELSLYDGSPSNVFSCKMLELADKDNQRKISRICDGVYKVKKRWSQTYGHHFILLDVEGRDYILIHSGNYYTNTEGCLLPGKKFVDINKDGQLDVSSSQSTLNKMLEICPDEWELVVSDYLIT